MGPMKMWLYNNFIIVYVAWPFMIYDLISHGKGLKAVATKYLKEWISFTKTITGFIPYKSKDQLNP